MLSRISRYYGLDDEVDRDPRDPDVSVLVTAPRVPPRVSGTFQHTLAEGDRLDQLAFRYYREPRKWWLICDAHPEFLSPLELVGRGPLETVRIPLAPAGDDDGPPGWAALAAALATDTSVVSFRFVHEPEELAVIVTRNRFAATAGELRETVSSAGFAARAPEPLGRVGKPITVPPDTVR